MSFSVKLLCCVIFSLSVNQIQALVCVPAPIAYGTVAFETGCQLGYGVANLVKLNVLGIPLCILIGAIEALVPFIQGLIVFFLPVCVAEFPPVDDAEKAYISETVSISSAVALGFLLGGPLLGPLLSLVLILVFQLKSSLFQIVRPIAEFLDTTPL